MLFSMATNGKLPALVYQFITLYVKNTGRFPYTYQIAEGCNIQASTAETMLKVLESRGLVQRIGRKRRYRLEVRGNDRPA